MRAPRLLLGLTILGFVASVVWDRTAGWATAFGLILLAWLLWNGPAQDRRGLAYGVAGFAAWSVGLIVSERWPIARMIGFSGLIACIVAGIVPELANFLRTALSKGSLALRVRRVLQQKDDQALQAAKEILRSRP